MEPEVRQFIRVGEDIFRIEAIQFVILNENKSITVGLRPETQMDVRFTHQTQAKAEYSRVVGLLMELRG